MSNDDLPGGWVEASLGEIIAPSKEKIEPSECPNCRYLSLEHVESQTARIIGSGNGADVESTKAVFQAGDVLYGKLRPYLNKVCIPDFDGICSTDILVFPNSSGVENRFLLRFLMQPEVVEYANHNSNGIQLPRISFEKLAQLPFKLPPSAEQKRIVAKVDALLSRVNAARQRLAKVPAILKRFRQSVLAAACSGRLTADWRKQPESESGQVLISRILNLVGRSKEKADRNDEEGLDDLPKNWAWATFGELIKELRNGIGTKPNPNPPGQPILRISAVRSGKVILDDIRFHPDADNLISLYRLQDGDLLFTRYNGSLDLLGVCGMVRGLENRTLVYPDKLIRVRIVHSQLLPPYVELFFGSPQARDRIEAKSKSSAGQQGVSGADIKGQPIAVPPLPEQHEIVRRVEALFKLADAIEKRLAAATNRAEKLTQAILAKAFRGELVPTEAELARKEGRDYEPASALLERIRAERASQAAKSGQKPKPQRKLPAQSNK